MVQRFRGPLLGAVLLCLVAAVPSASAAAFNTTVLTIANPNQAADANFGWSVVALGDVNGDGTPDLAAGAPGADRAYIFSGARAPSCTRSPILRTSLAPNSGSRSRTSATSTATA